MQAIYDRLKTRFRLGPLDMRRRTGLAFVDVRREFLRARLNAEGGVQFFANQGSGVLTSAVWGDGLIDNPPQQAIRRGETVRFLPFSELLT